MTWRTLQHWLSLSLGGLILAACASTSIAAESSNSLISPSATASSPAVTHTPSGIFISTSSPSPRPPVIATISDTTELTEVIVQGRVYDAGRGLNQRLNNAILEWQFQAPDWQAHNGQIAVPDDGLYRLQLPVRPEDEIVLTARAPGYQPTTVRLFGRQLNIYGTRLNFGLVNDNGPLPGVPGSLGTVQLRGMVYNLARGLAAPIDQAHLTIVNHSLVRPTSAIDLLTNAGAFSTTLELHATDQLELTIAANDFITATLKKTAADLAQHPQITIGLQPAPQY